MYQPIDSRNLHYIKLIDMVRLAGQQFQRCLAAEHAGQSMPHLFLGISCCTIAGQSCVHNSWAHGHVIGHTTQVTPPAACSGHWPRLHGRQSNQRLHPRQDCVLPHAGASVLRCWPAAGDDSLLDCVHHRYGWVGSSNDCPSASCCCRCLNRLTCPSLWLAGVQSWHVELPEPQDLAHPPWGERVQRAGVLTSPAAGLSCALALAAPALRDAP